MAEKMSNEHFLTMDNLSPAVKNVQYAVRGKVVIRAAEIEKELKNVKYYTISNLKLIFFLIYDVYMNLGCIQTVRTSY